MNVRGWSDIAYSFLIDRESLDVRSTALPGATLLEFRTDDTDDSA